MKECIITKKDECPNDIIEGKICTYCKIPDKPLGIEEMTKDEKSQLLFLETCAVDNGGRIDQRHMNDDDRSLSKNWNDSGFIEYGRAPFHQIRGFLSHYVILSNEAWDIVGQLRKERGIRNQFKKEA